MITGVFVQPSLTLSSPATQRSLGMYARFLPAPALEEYDLFCIVLDIARGTLPDALRSCGCS